VQHRNKLALIGRVVSSLRKATCDIHLKVPFSLTESSLTYGMCTTHNAGTTSQGWGYWCARVP